jgi:hypothetical protein
MPELHCSARPQFSSDHRQRRTFDCATTSIGCKYSQSTVKVSSKPEQNIGLKRVAATNWATVHHSHTSEWPQGDPLNDTLVYISNIAMLSNG